MKEMIWYYLPRDILHCIYSEWLTWSDLSTLDIACLSNEDREDWLSSVSSIVVTQPCHFDYTTRLFHDPFPNEKLVNFYQWLGNRNILVRDRFPMRLSVLEDLLHYCDPVTFCPTLCSIVILNESDDVNEVDNDDNVHSVASSNAIADENDYSVSCDVPSLSCFFRHCNHLEKIEFVSLAGRNCDYRDHVVYTALNEELQDNQLVGLTLLRVTDVDGVVNEKIGSLLSKHAKSLKDLRMKEVTEDCCGVRYIFENLIKGKTALRVLNIRLYRGVDSESPIPLLSQYLSTAGMFLEVLHFNSGRDILTAELLILIGISCPNLEELRWDSDTTNIKAIEIYRLCPNFKFYSSCGVFMNADEGKNRFNLELYGDELNYAQLEDIMECVLLALQRGHYSQLDLTFALEIEDEKQKLVGNRIGSLVTSLCAKGISEDNLIALLPNFPRLEELKVGRGNAFTDRSLAVIVENGQKLTTLYIRGYRSVEFSDDMICQLFRKCNMLEVLEFPCISREGIVCAAQCLYRLRKVTFSVPDIRIHVEDEADIGSLLCGGEVRWPSSLQYGCIIGFPTLLLYDRHSRSWVDDGDYVAAYPGLV